MGRKKLSRIQIHKRICEKAGMTTHSHIGYLSRREMLDVLYFMDRITQELKEFEERHKTPNLRKTDFTPYFNSQRSTSHAKNTGN
jgi:hypothetical protein